MRITKLNKLSIGDTFCIVKVAPTNGHIMISKDGVVFDKSDIEEYINPLNKPLKRNKCIDFLRNLNFANESVCILDVEKPYIFFGPYGLIEYYIKQHNNNSYLVRTKLEENLVKNSKLKLNREEVFKIINPKKNENVVYVDRLLNIIDSIDLLYPKDFIENYILSLKKEDEFYKQNTLNYFQYDEEYWNNLPHHLLKLRVELSIMNQFAKGEREEIDIPVAYYSPLYALRTNEIESSLYEYYLSVINNDEYILEINKYELGNIKKMEKKLKK